MKHGAEDKIHCYTAMNEHDKAQLVTAQILAGFSGGRDWREHAVLYRMNAQFNQFEQAFKRSDIPHHIIGGIHFFDRAGVKDMIAYPCAVNNPNDDLHLSHIINDPPRGIGATTVERAQAIVQVEDRSLWDVVGHTKDFPELQKTAPRLSQLVELMTGLRELSDKMELPDFYEGLVQRTGYAVTLEQKNAVEGHTRLESAHEVLSFIQNYLENAVDESSPVGFLDEIALYTDSGNRDPSEDYVVMMIIHSIKGLKFPMVFMVDVEEDIFPDTRAIGGAEEMEEECRLCYVAMARVKGKLYITCASQRMLSGRTNPNRPSRFLGEIPSEHVEKSGHLPYIERAERETERPARRMSVCCTFDRSFSMGSATAPASAGAPAPDRKSPAAGRTPAGGALPGFKMGDSVQHKAFDRGPITKVTPIGGGALVKIAFDSVGTKKLIPKSTSRYMKKV